MNITWYMNFIEVKEEYKKAKTIFSNKETRLAIVSSQCKTSSLDPFKTTTTSLKDKINDLLSEKEQLEIELPDYKKSLDLLEKKYNEMILEIEEYKNDTKSENYLEINIFYYKYVLNRIYTLDDIKNILKIPYQESQIKLKSAELSKKILKEKQAKLNNRT